MKPIIVANWKANPATEREAVWLAREIERRISKLGISRYKNVEVVIAPPLPFLIPVAKVLKLSKIGAQNVFWSDIGPYTGEVSWRQLKNLGVNYVIVGHSERKIHLGETDALINKKVKALADNGLNPILCIGEEKREGQEVSGAIEGQLRAALGGVRRSCIKNFVVAYEPVWAISTMPGAKADTPDNAFRSAVYIRKIITDLYGRSAASQIRVIYGGSVNALNAASFFREVKMQGALVGGASLRPDEFVKIVEVASGK
jgi:triosephosphate isomerase